MYAKDVMDTDGQIHHDEVPLIAPGLSEQQVPWSFAFLRPPTQRSSRKRLLGMGVG